MEGKLAGGCGCHEGVLNSYSRGMSMAGILQSGNSRGKSMARSEKCQALLKKKEKKKKRTPKNLRGEEDTEPNQSEAKFIPYQFQTWEGKRGKFQKASFRGGCVED